MLNNLTLLYIEIVELSDFLRKSKNSKVDSGIRKCLLNIIYTRPWKIFHSTTMKKSTFSEAH